MKTKISFGEIDTALELETQKDGSVVLTIDPITFPDQVFRGYPVLVKMTREQCRTLGMVLQAAAGSE